MGAVKHKGHVVRAVCLLFITGLFSLSPILASIAHADTLSWITADPAFSVDAAQDKSVPAPCTQQQVYIGSDTTESDVCVVSRGTWRYGQYTHYVCSWTCSTDKGYAIGYGTDTKMYRMRNMPEFWAPYLVPGSNTMAVRDINYPYYTLGIIKDFQLQFNAVTAQDGSTEYVYNGSPYFQFNTPNGTRMKVQALGASANGNWLVVEAPDVGLFRINLETLEAKRFSNNIYTYWTGSNPSMEFAVSNDGSYVAAMGVNAGFTMYYVTDTCGDTLTDAMDKTTPVSSPCEQKDMGNYIAGQIPGFRFGVAPTFDETAGKLNFQADYQANGVDAIEWVTLTAAGSSVISTDNCLPYTVTGAPGTQPVTKCCLTSHSYPYMIRQKMGMQADNMKVACSADTSSDQGNLDAWYAWQSSCLTLDATAQATCKGVTLDEFLQNYAGGNSQNVSMAQ